MLAHNWSIITCMTHAGAYFEAYIRLRRMVVHDWRHKYASPRVCLGCVALAPSFRPPRECASPAWRNVFTADAACPRLSRVGPVRPPMDNKNPMGGNSNYKTAFKTPGYTDFKGGSVVDVAHCKVLPA